LDPDLDLDRAVRRAIRALHYATERAVRHAVFRAVSGSVYVVVHGEVSDAVYNAGRDVSSAMRRAAPGGEP
jgi:hypothetical protein